jgi:hypothetical protein
VPTDEEAAVNEQQGSINRNHQTRRAAFATWARTHWRTTAFGLVSALAIGLQRLPDRPRWQDVAAALLVAVLGVLANDNPGKPGSGPGTS